MSESDDLPPPVRFRLTSEEYKEAKSRHGLLKNDSINTFAKACLFVRINEGKQIEFQREAERKREEALKAHDIPAEGF
jgi:hypothetical protein